MNDPEHKPERWTASRMIEITRSGERIDITADVIALSEEAIRLRSQLAAALAEAHALIETAEQDGYVSPGWCEDARSWQACWKDALTHDPLKPGERA